MKSLSSLLLVITIVAGVIPATALAQMADSPWPTFKGNAQHTGLSPYPARIDEPVLKWKFDTGNGVESPPAIGPNGTIYVGAFRNHFFALNPDGTEKWRFTKEGEEFRSSPTIAQDGTIYVGAVFDLKPVLNVMYNRKMDYGVPKIYALNPDGILKWEFVAGGILGGTYNSPTIGPDGTVYIGSGGSKMTDYAKGGDRLWALNPDGTIKWSFAGAEAVYSSAAIGDDGTIYIGWADGNLFALTPEGKEKWRFTRKEGDFSVFDSTPAIGPDGTIYAGSTNHNLYAVTPNGQEKWHFTTLDMVEATPSIGPDGTIYVGTISKDSKDKNLYALNSDGTLKWKFATGDGVSATPAIDALGTLYFGSYDGYLYALDPNGKELWRYQTNGGITFPPALDNKGTLYFGSWDHRLYALGSQDQIVQNTTGNIPGPTKQRSWPIWLLLLFGIDIPIGVLTLIYFRHRSKERKGIAAKEQNL